MKTTTTFAMIAVMIGMIACTGRDKGAEQSVKNLNVYIDSIERDHSNYYKDENYWTAVESGYEEKRQQVEAKSAQMDDKLRKEYAELQKEYAALKEKYNAEHAKVSNYRLVLRNALFGEGVIGDDVSFNFMTATNAESVYENFVNTISNNKDVYSREDWDEIKVLYEAMDTRKNVIEKELSSADNRSIAAHKIRFASIKALNRPASKAEENSSAKE
ncbi:MAG: hypothetical protein V4590_10505 [Bacteroidota bacterium]